MDNNNPTQNSEIKPKIAKVASTEKVADTAQTEDAAKTNNSEPDVPETKTENLFASVYINEKNNLGSIERTDVTQNVEITDSETESETEKLDKEQKINIIFIVLTVLTVLIFVASCAYLIYGMFKEDNTEVTDVDAEITVKTSLTSPINIEHVYSDSYPEGMQEKFRMLYDQSPNIAGWIRVPNTSIDMPVYQWTDNNYYIRTDNYNVYNRYGTPFLDAYANKKTLSKNTVLHGHNFLDGLIFSELHNYTEIDFLKENPVIEYSSLYENYKWKIIAVFYTNGDSASDNDYLFYYVATSMGNNSFMEFYDEIQQRSLFHTGVDVQPTDKILTMNTCTRFFDINGVRANGRLAVIARLVREGESETVDTSLIKANENVRYPQLYYNKFGGENPYKNASKWVARND